MKPTTYVFMIAIASIISCKKIDQVSTPIPPPLSTTLLVANAGIDQVISLPTDNVTLDGSASTGTINSYQWTKISGPTSFSIQNAFALKTHVKTLVHGIYLFELTVTGISGISQKDTVQVEVIPLATPNLQLIPFGNLSQARYKILTASAGSKILFIGGRYLVRNCFYDSTDNGWWNCENRSTRVDIYDTSTLIWTTVDLVGSSYSDWGSAVTIGSKIYLAGGYQNSDRVDVYDASVNSWSAIQLPMARDNVVAVSLGDKIFFAGGESGPVDPSRVDIYNCSTNSWSMASLSVSRIGISGTAVGNKILFAGGHSGSEYSSTVDMYDSSANTWSVGALSSGRIHPKAVALNNKAFFAGGDAGNNSSNYPRVDIYDNSTQSWTNATLPFGNSFFNAVATDNKVLFFRMPDEISIYYDLTNSWSVGYLNKKTYNPGVVAIGKQVYVAGGNPDDGIHDQTNLVWKLEF